MEPAPGSAASGPPHLDGMEVAAFTDFLQSLDDYTPTLPDGLTEYYLRRCGFANPDVRLTRLISIAAQKFIAEIAADAHECCVQRMQATAKDKKERGFDAKDKRLVLTTEDLAAALVEYGVHLRKPPYFHGSAQAPAGGSAPPPGPSGA